MDYNGGMEFSFLPDDTIRDLQKFVTEVYAVPDDRIYSLWDLLVQEERFAMRALKGIRQNDIQKLGHNLLISFSWLISIANRLHIDVEEETWRRFPGLCSYCGKQPCACRTIKPSARLKITADESTRPKTLADTQSMFEAIYPANKRTLADAGVHLAEEIGEVSEAIHNYLGEHREEQFDEVKLELADLVSCIFGVANSAHINIAKELSKIYRDNCHICHNAPCTCTFSDIVRLRT
jgi:NTP pyrophosphatase (non-canonical NTP hydrolase)